jgi:putative component of membrane protein insertase Oxa1/YidC/SpoIIIJ protein YidD
MAVSNSQFKTDRPFTAFTTQQNRLFLPTAKQDSVRFGHSGAGTEKPIRIHAFNAEDPKDQALPWLKKRCLKAIDFYRMNTRGFNPNLPTDTMSFFQRNVYEAKKLLHQFVLDKVWSGCPFTPSCSEFTEDAIREFGPLKGIYLGAQRIFLRCNGIYPLMRSIRKSGFLPVMKALFQQLAKPTKGTKLFSDPLPPQFHLWGSAHVTDIPQS